MKTHIIARPEAEGKRLDIYLALEYPDYSRSYFSQLIKDEAILVNSKKAKPNYKLHLNDQIEISFKEKELLQKPEPESIPLDIIFENDDAIVLNKQPGIVVHPSAGHTRGTLVNAVLNHAPEIKEAIYNKKSLVSLIRPGLVHRLDKDTSGVLIMAKNARAMHSLSRQIQNRTVKKYYLGLCSGWPKKSNGTLTSYLGRHPKNRKLIANIGQDKGKHAVLDYEVIKYFKDDKDNPISLIRFNLKTGRTHQIRVQISDLGCPIIGDTFYGDKTEQAIANLHKVNRQLLHAQTLSIILPGDAKASIFEAPLPKDMLNFIAKLTQIA